MSKYSRTPSRSQQATSTAFGGTGFKAEAEAPRRSRLAKFALGCVLGLSALSSYAITIDQVIADTSSASEAMVIDPRYSWQYNPAVTMYSPKGALIPSWWTGNRPTYSYDVLTWFTAFEAQGNAATNTRVQIANLRFYVLSNSTRTWKQYDLTPTSGVDTWQYPFNYASNGGGRNESSGGISVKPKYPYFNHGYGTTVTINPQDVRATFVAMEYRLVVDDPSKPDDRASAKYVVDTGGDYWPGNGQGDWSLGYAPGMGNGRMLLATNNWRTATMLIPNSDVGATMEEMRTNPPPLPADSGSSSTTTTTKATTTTTAATTTTTKAATTTTTGVTTTTAASVTTTTLPSNAGTSSQPISTSGYSALPAKHSGKCMDVSGNSTDNGAAIVQWSCSNGANQKWSLRDMGGAQYQAYSKSSGKCLTVSGSSTADGAALQQNDCSNAPNQLWTRRTSASGHAQLVSVASGKCANVRGFSRTDGAVIEQTACTNSDSQMWSLPIAKPQALIAKHSSKCMDLSGWSTADGVAMQQWACNGGTNQQWTFKDMGNARYEVVSTASGKCLEVKGSGTADGTAVQQSSCTGGSNQLWNFQPEAGGYNKLKSVSSGKCMDVSAVSTTDGAKVQIWNCGITGGDNQRWMIK